ncbi:alanine racemase [Pseudomonas asiatica]|uniref:alanine racemase n=1 Tax=Pseudomonas asiatica TaxID=2219225 RepID=UPI003EBEBB6C
MKMKLTYSSLAFAIIMAVHQNVIAAPELQVYNFDQPVKEKIESANAWVEVSKSAFEYNIQSVQSSLAGGSKLCAVMKADAYGHGISLLIPSIIKENITCIGIASNDEARIARAEGYKGRIVRVRQAAIDEIKHGMQYDVEEMIGNADLAKSIGAVASAAGMVIRVHVVTNAGGMSRNGLELKTDQGKADALSITRTPGLKTVGIMTHFAVEDKSFVEAAHRNFVDESGWIIKHSGLKRSEIQLHCANSFATAEVPSTHMDMVRVGGSLYGDLPGHDLRRVMSFKSRVAAVNTYPAGNTVGYDRTFTLKRDSKLANIAVGYSDGYRRLFTNKSYVIIDGERVPTVGKVSMNTLMADVTDLPNVKPGDEVVIFGKQKDGEISAGELEEINGALLADLYTVWGNSNIRVLVD